MSPRNNVREIVSHEDVLRYEKDGVVCLRRAFDGQHVATARQGIDRNLRNPGRFFRDHTSDTSAGRYVFDFWNWPAIPEFAALMQNSPLGRIGTRILRRDRVLMLMDNWFLREQGAADRAPWHHDEPYFDFEGKMCIVWIPLDSVGANAGLRFVRGSHLWGKLFAAQQFSENVPFECLGDRYHPMPDIDARPADYDIVGWDLEPGDCLAFDFRTIHSCAPDSRASKTTRRMTFRLGGDDVTFQPRGEWTREITEFLQSQGQVAGETLANPLIPVIYEARGRLGDR